MAARDGEGVHLVSVHDIDAVGDVGPAGVLGKPLPQAIHVGPNDGVVVELDLAGDLTCEVVAKGQLVGFGNEVDPVESPGDRSASAKQQEGSGPKPRPKSLFKQLMHPVLAQMRFVVEGDENNSTFQP